MLSVVRSYISVTWGAARSRIALGWTFGRGRVALVALAACTVSMSMSVNASAQTLILAKDSAAPNGTLYRRFRNPFVSDFPGFGIAFVATSKSPTTKLNGLFREDDDPNVAGVVLVQKGDSIGDVKFRKFNRPAINSSGETAFKGLLTTISRGMFRQPAAASSPTLVAIRNDPVNAVPALPGTNFFDDFGFGDLTNSGIFVFFAEMTGGSIREAIFQCSGGNGSCVSGIGTGTLVPLVVQNDIVDGRQICSFSSTTTASTWGIGFRAVTKSNCSSVFEVPREGVFRKPFGGPAKLLALEGDPVDPGLAPGVFYGTFNDRVSIQNTGKTVFQSETEGNLRIDVLFFCDPGAACPTSAVPEAVIAEGDDDGAGSTFRRMETPQITDAGDIVFGTALKGARRGRAIFERTAGGSLQRIAAKNDPVPGHPDPTATFRLVGPPSVSPGGRIAFSARIKASMSPRGTALFLKEP